MGSFHHSHAHATDIRITAASVHFLPIVFRVPLKFGPETCTEVICLRVRVTVADRRARTADGWGETPLAVSWTWPTPKVTVADRTKRMQDFSLRLAKKLVEFGAVGHPMEIGYDFQKQGLMKEVAAANAEAGGEAMPYLGALVVPERVRHRGA